MKQFVAGAEAFDACIAETEGVDHFCSSTRWIIPASRALMPEREPWLFRGEHAHVALMRGDHPRGFVYAEPLEATWGLACPIACTDVDAACEEFCSLVRRREKEWDVLVLAGIPAASQLLSSLIARMGRHYQVGLGPRAVRHVASLRGGMDGFLSRRSANLRRSLAKASRRAQRDGLVFEEGAGSAAALYGRIQDIEARSWKGKAGVGIEAGGMREFYRLMLRRLVPEGAHRVLFARQDSRDVGYILGGLWRGDYRGLQCSFDAACHRYSLGNLLQLEQVRRLVAEGVQSYDLGTSGLDYKSRWSETQLESVSVLVVRRPL